MNYKNPELDWNEIEKWDRNYYLHNTQSQSEYVFTGVEATNGNYLYLSNGSKLLDFVGVDTSINCTDSNFAGPTLIVDDTFDNANSINSGSSIIELGQTFNDGIAPPDFNRHSGEVIYIDNRAPITRSSSQKEEVKIVVEF